MYLSDKTQNMTAFSLFYYDEEIIQHLSDISMDEFHKDADEYRDMCTVIDIMLEECEPDLEDNELAETLLYEPEYENDIYDFNGCVYKEERCFAYKSEIYRFKEALSKKFEEYDKFLTEINVVNAGVALMLLVMS
jgi:hypothetical protein